MEYVSTKGLHHDAVVRGYIKTDTKYKHPKENEKTWQCLMLPDSAPRKKQTQ